MLTGTDPTRKDAGRSGAELHIEIVLNPVNKTVSISENVGDPILFYGILEQARQIYAANQHAKQLPPPNRVLTLPKH